MDYIELSPTKEMMDEMAPDAVTPTAFRIEGTMREYAAFKPVNCLFNYPIHIVDTEGILNDAKPFIDVKPRERGTERNKENTVHRHNQLMIDIQNALDRLADAGQPATIYALAEAMQRHKTTVQKWIGGKMSEFFWVDKNDGNVIKERIDN